MRGVPMDPDMNKYDLEHACTAPSDDVQGGVDEGLRDAWTRYYTDEHVETVMRRAVVTGLNRAKDLDSLTIFSGARASKACIRCSSVSCAARSARNGATACPSLNPLMFYPWRASIFSKRSSRWLRWFWRYRGIMARVNAAPAARTYIDDALRPHTARGETDHFVEIFADKIPHTHGAPARAPAAVAS